jgi:lipopolysaccharide/colanic/teichoic acid biosynthesis glycosyltransferase
MQRAIDIIISASGLIFLSPILLPLAIITEVLTPDAFVCQNNRLKFRPVHPVVRRFSLDELPALIDILLGQQSFFNEGTRALFWPAETGTEEESGKNWVGVVVVWLLSVLVLYLIYLSVK